MNTNPQVSIIIPFYNRSFLMRECLSRIALQTYQNVEIVAVDDCSTEDTSFIKNLVSQYIRVEKNAGPGNARRVGREAAKGELVAYLDSDDWWSANFLAECVQVLNNHPECGMAYTDTIQIKNGEEQSGTLDAIKPDNLLPDLFKRRQIQTSSAVWRKEVSLPHFWYPLRDFEDYIHEVQCASINNNICFVDKALAYKNAYDEYYTVHSDTHGYVRSLAAIVNHTDHKLSTHLTAFALTRILLKSSVDTIEKLRVLLAAIKTEYSTDINRSAMASALYLLYKLKIKKGRHSLIKKLRSN